MDSLTDGEEGVEIQSEWVDERQEVEANEQQRILINQKDELDQQIEFEIVMDELKQHLESVMDQENETVRICDGLREWVGSTVSSDGLGEWVESSDRIRDGK